ncbi:unnamed protein product [Rotaria sp. Silwood1]|nr:unnamed protein product [Rotaria sp. Silwood1]
MGCGPSCKHSGSRTTTTKALATADIADVTLSLIPPATIQRQTSEEQAAQQQKEQEHQQQLLQQITNQDFEIIWLDEHQIDKSQIPSHLTSLVDDIKFFSNAKECIMHISNVQTKSVFFVYNPTLTTNLHDFPNVDSHLINIHMYRLVQSKTEPSSTTSDQHRERLPNDDWFATKPAEKSDLYGSNPAKDSTIVSLFPVNNEFKDITFLLQKLHLDVYRWREGQGTMSVLRPIGNVDLYTIDSGEHSTHILKQGNNSFMWSQILIEILLRIPVTMNAINETLHTCKEIYKDNASILSQINEFKESYTPDLAIHWYTRDSFIFRTVNKTLRTGDIELIFKLRFYIRDLYNQLKAEHSASIRSSRTITAYRGTRTSKDEIEFLKKSVNGFIIMNSFVSTTVDRTIALMFADASLNLEDTLQNTLFEITLSPHIQTRPYADITHISHFFDEGEILLSLGMIFRIDLMEWNGFQRLWVIKLTACEVEDPQLRQLIDHYKNSFGEIADNLTLGDMLSDIGDYDRAVRFYQMPCDIQQPDHIEEGMLKNNIGWLYSCKGNFAEALKHFEQAFELESKHLPDNHQDLAAITNNIGMIYYERDDYRAALANFQKSLDIKLKADSKSEESIAITYSNIGLVHHKKGAHEEALKNYNEALELQKNLPELHPELATTYANIGTIHCHRGDFLNALNMYKKVLEIRLTNLETNHPLIAKAYLNIGIAFEGRGDYLEAKNNYQKALEIQLQSLSADHSDIGTTYVRFGSIHTLREDYDLALEYQQKALEIYQKSHSVNRLSLATVYNNMGLAYERKLDNVQALDYYEKALEVYLQNAITSQSHPSMITVYGNLGRLSISQQDHQRALECFEKALEISRKVYPNDHPSISLYRVHSLSLRRKMGLPELDEAIVVAVKEKEEEKAASAVSAGRACCWCCGFRLRIEHDRQ